MLFDLNNNNPVQTILTLTFKREKNKSAPAWRCLFAGGKEATIKENTDKQLLVYATVPKNMFLILILDNKISYAQKYFIAALNSTAL